FCRLRTNMTTPLPPSSDGAPTSRARLDWRSWGALAVALIAIYSAMGWLRDEPVTDSDTQQPEVSYDAWSTGITSVLYDTEGNIEYTLQAERQTHYLNDTTELISPNLQLLQDNGSNWHITARSGRILGAAEGGRIEQLDLSNQVNVNRIAATGELMTLETTF